MSYKLISAVDDGRNYRFAYHVDESRLAEDGAPDPAWISEYVWGKLNKNQGETAAAFATREAKYLAMATEEAERTAADEHARRCPVLTPL